VKKLQNILCS